VAKQSKLAFSTKSNTNGNAPSATTGSPEEDVEMKDDSDSDVKPKVKRSASVEAKENHKPQKGICQIIVPHQHFADRSIRSKKAIPISITQERGCFQRRNCQRRAY